MPTPSETVPRASSPYAEPIQNIASNLGHLSKLYNDEMKYGGSDDSFALKLDIFHDCYRRACLPHTPKSYALALPTMLKGEA